MFPGYLDLIVPLNMFPLQTGIGGGAALFAFQLGIALGANVYVTSGEQAKIDKAIEMGAKGGVCYKSGRYS